MRPWAKDEPKCSCHLDAESLQFPSPSASFLPSPKPGMLHDLHSRPFSNGAPPKRPRSSSASGGNGEAADGHKVGLLPSKGWRERNFRFLNDVLIPHLLAPRRPRGASSLLGELTVDQTGATWLGHAGFLLQLGGKNI